jgi:hypothetical protein
MQTQSKATFIVGHNIAGVPVHNTATIAKVSAQVLDNLTAYDGRGVTREWGEESATVLFSYGLTEDAAMRAAQALARVFQQDAVALEFEHATRFQLIGR